MRHSRILVAAIAAGLGGPAHQVAPSSLDRQLYDYARERKFPPPETLARKAAELAGGDFPFVSLAEAPEPMRVFFTAFRAVVEALEPFREEDTAGEAETVAADKPTEMALDVPVMPDPVAKLLAETSCKSADDLVDMAQVGNSLMESVRVYTTEWPLEGWTPAQDPAEIVGDLVAMLWETPIADIEAGRKKLEKPDASSSAGAVAASQTADGTEVRDGAEQTGAGVQDLAATGPGEAAEVEDPAEDAGGDAAAFDPAKVDERPADAPAETSKNKKKNA